MSSLKFNAQSPKFFRVTITLSLLVLSTILVGHVHAEDVTLAWDANSGAGGEISGYRVYYGTDGSTFPNQGCDVIDTTCAVSGLTPGQTYHFVATSYNNNGESDHSDPPISYTVPAGTSNYTIFASASANGSISPSGAIAVSGGGSQSFSIQPNGGHHVDDVIVDGKSIGAVSSHSFNIVSSNHTIEARFAADENSYEISASAGNGGSISPAGTVPVNHGGSQAFTITAGSGYQIADVRVDGVSVGTASTYTFNNVFSDYAISVFFEPVSDSPLTPNQTPDPPALMLPENGVDEIALTPLLEISGFSDPDSGDIHGATRWQIAADGGFNHLILDIVCDMETTNSYLLSLKVPQGTFTGEQTYYWRAMVKDARASNAKWSDWSVSYSFTTAAEEYADINANGVPDEFEPLTSDLDDDGQNDNDQPLMRVLKMNTGASLLGLKAVEGVSGINRFTQIDPASIFDLPRPVLPYGLMSLNVILDQIGGTARFELFLPESSDASARWFKYDPINGWYEFPVQNMSGKFILEIVDGGFGDADGVANGIIVDPIGISDSAAVNEVADIDTGASENTMEELLNSCFIVSTRNRSTVSSDSCGIYVQRLGVWSILYGFLILGLAGVLIRKADRRAACGRR